MAQGKRDRLSTEQRIEMWRRWKAGESLHDIGRAFGKGHGSIRFLLTQRGGIVPAARRRSPRTLTLAEREDISRGIASGSSIREIASGLHRPVSTVSGEVLRHGGRPLYRASEADRQAWNSALRPKVCLLAIDQKLRTIVASKLILDWSPEQVSKWLKVHYPSNERAKHKSFTVDTNVKVYFCDPQSPWQRGTNENTNGLLRQYFPKKTDLSVYSQADLNKVAMRLNQRPRKTLGFETPASKLQASVASTG
jgi:IS30 family transposase